MDPTTTTSTTTTTAVTDSIIYDGVDHCGVIVSDVEKALPFYLQILGFLDDTEALRPKTLSFPGAFLRAGKQQIHLMQIPNPYHGCELPQYPGRDRHIAIAVNSIELLQERLTNHGISYHLSSSGRKALFCRDFDGNGFEFLEPIPTSAFTMIHK